MSNKCSQKGEIEQCTDLKDVKVTRCKGSNLHPITSPPSVTTLPLHPTNSEEFKLRQRLLFVGCEKVDKCSHVSQKCYCGFDYDPNTSLTIPARRWLYCAGWKMTLGLKFDKETGTWVPKCTGSMF